MRGYESKSKKMRQYYNVAITVDNGLSFGPSKRFYLDSTETGIRRSLLDDDISWNDAHLSHALKLRAHGIYQTHMEDVLRLRKRRGSEKGGGETKRDAMPDSLRAEADKKAAISLKEAKKKDQERLEGRE